MNAADLCSRCLIIASHNTILPQCMGSEPRCMTLLMHVAVMLTHLGRWHDNTMHVPSMPACVGVQ